MKAKYSKKFLAEVLSTMYLGRKFEEKVQLLFSKGMVHGTTHLGIGEEGTATGTILALKEKDFVFGTHRGHAQALAKGLDLNETMAEILAKATGVCGGLGGSMHIADPHKYYYGADGVLGASAVIAGGTALSIKKKQEKDRIALIFFGDGTANEGAVFESMNLAAVWNLPLLFVCINNTYGMSTHISKVMKDTDIKKRAYPFGMQATDVDGNDVLAVYECVKEAREYVLKNGPMLIVENTYRISGHSKSDGNLYRTKEEIAEWKGKCPIKRYREYLAKNGFSQKEMDDILEDIINKVDTSVELALASPEPTMEQLINSTFA